MQQIQQWKEQALEGIETAREKVIQFWKPLNIREKWILGVAGTSFASLLFYVLLSQTWAWVGSRIQGEQISEREIRQVQRLVEDLMSHRMEIRRYERLRLEKGENFNLESYIRDQANQLGLSIRSLEPIQPTTPLVGPEEEYLELKLELQSPLAGSLRLLDQLESILGVRVVTLSMKPNFSDRSQVEVTAGIAHRSQP